MNFDILQVFDKNYLNNFMGEKPSFTKRLYTANIDGISFELHNPIILNNCGTIDPTFELDSSKFQNIYFFVHIIVNVKYIIHIFIHIHYFPK